MTQLTKQQTELIRTDIKQKGISHPDLAEDLVDHVCSAVETSMASGESFEQAYAKAMSQFGKNELKQVQVKTQALLSGEKIYYPNIKQSALLLLVYIFLLFLIGMLIRPLQLGDPDFFDQHVIIMESIQVCVSLLLVILIARMELNERSFTKVDIAPFHPFPLNTFPVILCILFLWSLWMEIIHTFIPLPDAIKVLINQRLAHNPSLTGFLCIGIIWPILSEILFRGIILKGLLRKFTPLQAILYSSLFFSVSLVDAFRVIPLFLMGVFCGWLFYKTHSLLPSILAIIFAQLPGIVYIIWAKPQHHEQLMLWKNFIGNDALYYSLGVVSFLLTIFLLWRLKKLFDRQPQIKLFSIE